jgi:hypothetical protein
MRKESRNMNRVTMFCTAAMALLTQYQVYGYTCTLKNESYATIVVEFYRYSRPASGDITVTPGGTGQWDAGKCALIFPCSISGMRIKSMKWGNREVPGAAGAGEEWHGFKSHAASQTWVITQEFMTNDQGKTDRIRFHLRREPAGVGGSTYPGGLIWTSEPMSIR